MDSNKVIINWDHSKNQLNKSYIEAKNENVNKNKHKNEFLCGWGASFINICITFPINKIIFNQMAYGVKAKNAVDQLKGESIVYIYRGIIPPLLSKTVSVSIMFGTYHKYQEVLLNHTRLQNKKLSKTIAAVLAGCTEAILTPFERIQMLLQHKAYDHTFNNTCHAFLELKKYGLKEYYRGLTPILLRNGPSNVVYFSSRDFVKNNLTESSLWYVNLTQDFISGALIGAITSTIFYPLNAVRTKMQISSLHNKPLNILEASKLLYIERDRNLRKIYNGVHINFTRALLSWGIITASYEFLKKNLF